MIRIPTAVVQKIPLVGPTIGAVGIALDIKDIAEGSTPLGVAKIVGGRLYDECTPPELWLTGKCLMVTGGVIASVYTGGNPLVLGGTFSAFRAIIKNVR